MNKLTRCPLILAFGILATCWLFLNSFLYAAPNPSDPVKERTFTMGFTPFPWDFTIEAIDETYKFIAENGDIIAHHLDAGVPWTEALEDKPFSADLENDWKRRVQVPATLKKLVSLTPLNGDRKGMALYRGEKENMPLPVAFQNKPLDDPIIKKAYLNYCRRAVQRFQPDYLAIGIEVNELFHNSPEQWPHFLNLYQYTYTELKKEHPQLPIFATFTLHNLRNSGWKDMDIQQKTMKEFLPQNDIIGISYYPFMIMNLDHAELDFQWLHSFTNKPIAVCETGFPAETIRLPSFNLTIPADPERQRKFYETLLATANQNRYRFVISFLHRDYDALWDKIKNTSPEAFIVWKDCGLLDEQGKKRPAYNLWKQCWMMSKK